MSYPRLQDFDQLDHEGIEWELRMIRFLLPVTVKKQTHNQHFLSTN